MTSADRDGWTDRTSYSYQTSPNEKRGVGADVRQANDTWTVVIYDMADAVGVQQQNDAAANGVTSTSNSGAGHTACCNADAAGSTYPGQSGSK